MIIDSHQHYWRLARGDYGWLTPELKPIHRDFEPADLAPLLEAAGVSRTIAVQAAPTEAETNFLLDLAKETPGLSGVVGWVDFDSPDAPGRIAALARNRLLVGLRPMIHDIADPEWMLSPAVGAALEAMLDHGLVFDALVRPLHLSRLLVLADRHPDLPIVIDHCAKPRIRDGLFEPWASDMQALARRGNVYVKLSGLATEAAAGWSHQALAPYVRLVMRAFGSGRLLWGSDWPVLNLAGDYESWIKASEALLNDLPQSESDAVMGGNAARVYLSKRGRISC
jgi:L-fuconolactonase